jgi:diacylglycerol kinase
MPYKKENRNPFIPAFSGFLLAFKTERNVKIHIGATVIVLFAGFYFSLKPQEWCWILLAIVAVLAAELFNTAIEQLADMVQPNKDERIKKIKDYAAAAVLLCAMFAVAVGVFVFLPYLTEF